jgi:chorismate--pyruvate lyase
MTSEHSRFPLGLNILWQQSPPAQLSALLCDWLLDPSSLTARLKSHSQHFEVQLLGQKIDYCSAAEAKGAISAGDKVLIREVLLICDGRPHVFARSLLPVSTLSGDERQLADLGQQPLGQVLFNHPELRRESFEVGELSQGEPAFDFAVELSGINNHNLWGRRSLFYLGEKPLMVAEVFLPGAKAYEELENDR